MRTPRVPEACDIAGADGGISRGRGLMDMDMFGVMINQRTRPKNTLLERSSYAREAFDPLPPLSPYNTLSMSMRYRV